MNAEGIIAIISALSSLILIPIFKYFHDKPKQTDPETLKMITANTASIAEIKEKLTEISVVPCQCEFEQDIHLLKQSQTLQTADHILQGIYNINKMIDNGNLDIADNAILLVKNYRTYKSMGANGDIDKTYDGIMQRIATETPQIYKMLRELEKTLKGGEMNV